MPQSREVYNAYQREYQLARYYRRQNEAREALGGRCARCGSDGHLQFDHVNREDKSFTIAKMWSVSEEKFRAELAKCQLLCVPCHKEKTSSEVSVPHGGGVSGKYNCRCEPCRKRKAQYMEKYMETYVRKDR